jgi:hypothetical protein
MDTKYYVWAEMQDDRWSKACICPLTQEQAEALRTVLEAFSPDNYFTVSTRKPVIATFGEKK